MSFQIPSFVFTNDAMVLMSNGFHTTILQQETIQESVLDLLAFPNTVPVRGALSQLQGYKFRGINSGWSEPAATNAPVEDEAVQAILGMNQKHILPCLKFWVFSVSSLWPQSFSLLPTSPPPIYILPPTSHLSPPPTYLT
jgi:hypothetical protein